MSAKLWIKQYAEGVRSELEYPQVPLFKLLDQSTAAHPQLPALDFFGHKMTYMQLTGAVNKCANALLAMGIAPGDRVALMMPNCPQYVIAYYGILKAGAVVAQVNPLYVQREIEYLCNNAGATLLMVADVLYPKVQAALPQTSITHVLVSRMKGDIPLGPEAVAFETVMEGAPHTDPGIEVSPDGLAVLQYTGGTTGVSKGAMLTHKNLVANVVMAREWFKGIDMTPGSQRFLTILPLFHSYGMTACMNFGLYVGAELILLPRFELPEVMATIKRTQPTSFPGVPTMYVAVNSFPNAEDYGVSSILLCNSGGAAMPVEVMRVFEERFGTAVVEGFGLSETSPVTHCNPYGGVRKPGSVGIAYPDTDCRIVDLETGTKAMPLGENGELIIKGPQVMAGYWQMEEETRNTLRDFEGETWLYTGDICRMDVDGFVFVTDRKKDMIIAGGFNIYPRDVEEVLYMHPAIQEAVVAGVPDAYRGETVKAYVILKPGMTLTSEALDQHCRAQLASFKVPRIYEFRDTLPKSAVGKILRRVLVAAEKEKIAKGPDA
jgi:long-chain acyl-CoA synthetase